MTLARAVELGSVVVVVAGAEPPASLEMTDKA